MKKIRIGNDIYVAWQIFGQDGVPYNLVGKSLVLDMRVHNPESSTGETVIPVTNFSVTYNTLYFTFWGVNQTLQGLYILKLRENIEGGGQKTLDTKEAFTLVGHSWDQSDDDSGLLISMTSFVGVGLRGEKGDKGDQGDKGDTGDPGIETASVTVDATTGTPSATATITNKNLALSFSGIKGEQGIQGIQGVQGPKGDQGNTGSSVDYPYELVNNLTTDDSTKGLTAAMGKQIGDNISQLGQEKFDKTLADNAFYIMDASRNIIARIDSDGVSTIDLMVKIDGELVSVKSLLSTLSGSVATEQERAETEEEKKLDHTLSDNKFIITDADGNIIVKVDKDGIHSAMSKHAVACMVFGEYYYPTSAPTRDANGNITHAEVMFGTGVAGSVDITYSGVNAAQVLAHYGDYTYTVTIQRDENGNVEVVSVN